MSNTRNIYLDHAASTPIDPRVLGVIQKISQEYFGNPSSIHKEGVEAKKILERARKDIAESVGALPDEILFMSGGTEANNLAIFGTIKNPKGSHIIVSSIEHPSVLECVEELAKRGTEVTYLPVSESGIVSPKDVSEAIRENTVLVSVMYANNEIGTIQPIAEIAKVIRMSSSKPLFHTDACQSLNYLDMNVLRLGVDMMTFNASKIYGGKGMGALYVKRGVKISPIIFGGGQERGVRSGTENLASICGFAEAVKNAEEIKNSELVRLTELRDYFISEVKLKIPTAVLNGDAKLRLPNNVNFSFPGCDGEEIVIGLDARGVSASTGSACANIAIDGKVSHVLTALGYNKNLARGGVRFTLGRSTTREDMERVVEELFLILNK